MTSLEHSENTKYDILDISNINNDNQIFYNYEHKLIPIKKINIINECYSLKIINEIKNMFNVFLYSIVSTYPAINKILIKSYNKVDELIQRWCWHQYNLDDTLHNVIPLCKSGNYDWDRFIKDLAYICDSNDILEIIESQILIKFNKRLHNYLTIEYNNLININLEQNYDIIKINNFEENTQKIILLLKHNDNIEFETTITRKTYDKLKKKLLVNKKYQEILDISRSIDYQIDEIILSLLMRYDVLDSKNQQLAIIEEIKYMFKNIGFNFELFGSAINTYSDNYCSLFTDLEIFFGSKSNFFDMKLNSGLYWCNPPYDDTIMTLTGKKLVEWLEKNNDMIFLVTIPIWYTPTQQYTETLQYSQLNEYFNINDKNINDKNINLEQYNEFQIYKQIKPYIQNELLIPKNRIPYFNYKRDVYIYAVNTYLLCIYHPNINKKYQNIINKINESFQTIHNNDLNNMYINRDKKNIYQKNKKLTNTTPILPIDDYNHL